MSEMYLYKLDEVLGQFIISQEFVKAAYSEVPDHRVWVVTVQQLHGLLRTDRGPFFQQTVHLEKTQNIINVCMWMKYYKRAQRVDIKRSINDINPF